MASIKSYLEEVLVDVDSTADFALHRALVTITNPGLTIEGVGSIGLPVSPRDVESIIAVSKQSPFGFKSETRIDTDVRRTFELSPAQFKLENPAWSTFMQSVLAEVAAAFDIHGGGQQIHAEPNKLLIYEKDCMFDKHKDSEKADGMFGSLVVALPCEHTGGDVIVDHDGDKKVLATARTSKFGMSYLAWFSDVSHQVTKVTSGHRVVLTYNLLHSGNQSLALTAEMRCGEQAAVVELSNILGQWKDLDQASAALIYVLDHKYTEANMRQDHLKGLDSWRGNVLVSAAARSGFYTYLASLERYVEGGCDDDDYCGGPTVGGYHEITDVCSESTTLKKMYGMNGLQFAKDVDIEEEQVIQENAFEDIDEEDYSGWTGNEGVSATHYYRSTAIVIVNSEKHADFFFDSMLKKDRGKIEIWLGNNLEELKRQPADEYLRIEASQLVSCILAYNEKARRHVPANSWSLKPTPLNGRLLGLAAEASITIERPDQLMSVVGQCTGRLVPEVYHALGLAAKSDSSILKRQEIARSLRATSPADNVLAISQIDCGIGGGDYNAYFDVDTISSLTPTLANWASDNIDDVLAEKQRLGKKDGIALSVLYRWMPNHASGKYLPLIERHVEDTAFAFAFLSQLIQVSLSKPLVYLDGQAQFLTLAPGVIAGFSLKAYKCTSPATKRARIMNEQRDSPQAAAPGDTNVSGEDIAEVLSHCSTSGIDDMGAQLEQRIIEASSHVDPAAFKDVLIPFLVCLLEEHERPSALASDSSGGIPLSSIIDTQHKWGAICLGVLQIYLSRYVQTEPPKSSASLARPRVSCNCQDCFSLNLFLASPTQQVGRFAIGQARRQHLHQKLNGSDCTHETERIGNPQTLVDTKKDRAIDQYQAWELRRKEAEVEIAEFDQDLLKTVLGRNYKDIVGIAASVTEASSASRVLKDRSVNAAGTSGLGPGAGTKRGSSNNPIELY